MVKSSYLFPELTLFIEINFFYERVWWSLWVLAHGLFYYFTKLCILFSTFTTVLHWGKSYRFCCCIAGESRLRRKKPIPFKIYTKKIPIASLEINFGLDTHGIT